MAGVGEDWQQHRRREETRIEMGSTITNHLHELRRRSVAQFAGDKLERQGTDEVGLPCATDIAIVVEELRAPCAFDVRCQFLITIGIAWTSDESRNPCEHR